jgi:hypothetical protein
MKCLAQKSLKTELRLKRYEFFLSLQGLKHKIAELKISLKSKPRINL